MVGACLRNEYQNLGTKTVCLHEVHIVACRAPLDKPPKQVS